MEVARSIARPAEADLTALIVGIPQDAKLQGAALEFDRACGGAISRLMETKEFSGKPNEVLLLHALPGIKSPVTALVGLGEAASLDAGRVFRAAGAAARAVSCSPRATVGCVFGNDWSSLLVEAAVCGVAVGSLGQDLYRKEKKRHPFERLVWWGASDESLRSGKIIAESVNLARRLVNEPPSHMYPETFAHEAERVARECGLEAEIWDQVRLEKEGCGSLLAVASGSSREPRLVILSYRGGGKAAPLALVGKGVTFDSGGLSIKPSDGMKTMKCDMAGGAAVIAAIRAISLLKLPLNVIALVGLVENMTGPAAYKLGDVLTARSGKTIEVLNTDAEGRLVLADVLSVALERGEEKIVDLATLTGACMVALGTEVAGLMTNHQEWCDTIAAAARRCGEPCWQLPMYPEYGEQIRSEVADIKNVGEGRWGGAITAAKFLEEFVDGRPWTHIDIAGPSFMESPKPWLDGGGTGCFVRTLVELARQQAV